MARGKRAASPPAIKIREMRPRDVPQVVAIENATSTTPWTRAMFMSELGRPGTLDLVADRGGDVLAYVMVSRYADVWHILNLCVRESQRGRGLGGRMLDELFVRADRRAHLGFTLEVRVSNAPAIHLYRRKGFLEHGVRPGYYSDNGEDAIIMWRDGGPEEERWGAGPILAIETSCDETAAAVVRGREIVSSVVASQADLHAPYGGVVPEVAARHHLGTVNAVVDAALERAGLALPEVDAVAVTQRPGLIGALLVGVATAKALAYAARPAPDMVDHLHGHIAASGWSRWPRPALRQPGRLGRPHPPGPGDRLRAPPRARPDDRRRGGGGHRQGRAPARPRLPGRTRAGAPGARGRPHRAPRSRSGSRGGPRATSRSRG